MDLFSYDKMRFKLSNSPVKLFESFSGIGTQAMALKRLGVEIEHVGISEIDKHAINSYVAIHGDVKNYGDICKINGKELPQIDIFTWSFPCTDLSKAGKQKGLNGTRSGLGYEVIRIISEIEDKPKMLLMENVPDLLSEKFKDGWREIYHEIEKLGYTNYVEILNAKDYGVAQNRDRVFMVSVLGDYAYTFPKPFELNKRLKDYLETDVDEKYYLSDKMLEFFKNNNEKQIERGNGFRFEVKKDEDTARSITTNSGNRMDDNFIGEPKIAYALKSREYASRGWLDQSPTLTARDYKDPKIVMIPEATKKGYAIAKDGDGVYINRPHQKRGVVQDGMIQTLKTSSDDVGVVLEEVKQKVSVREYDVNVEKLKYTLKKHKKFTNKQIANYLNQSITLVEHWFRNDGSFSIPSKEIWFELKKYLDIKTDEFDLSITSYIEKDNEYEKSNRVYHTNGISPTLTSTTANEKINHNLRIRKLTPLECWRLMGISDEDFYKAQKVCSNSQLYKQAGNGIVVDVLYHIFKEAL